MAQIVLLAVVAVVAGAAFLLLRHHGAADRMPTGWTASTAGKDYGATVEVDGSFNFPRAPNAVHYVTKACDGLTGKQIRLRYRIEGGPFYPISNPGQLSIGPTLYYQRKGDDWSGLGKYDGFRWYATFAAPSPIVAGEHEIVAPFDAKWTGVEHYNSVDQAAAFRDALENAERVGFVFGGGTGYGHGVYGTGRFTLLELAVE